MLYQNSGEQVKTYVYMSQCMIFPTMWYVQPAKPQMSLCKSIEYSMIVKLLTDFVCFVALRPKSTAMVIGGRSVYLTTLFPGQA